MRRTLTIACGLVALAVAVPCHGQTGDLTASGTSATGGSGDVTGPASAADNDLTVFSGTTGKLIKVAPVRVSDEGDTTLFDNQQNALEFRTAETLRFSLSPSVRAFESEFNVFQFYDSSDNPVALIDDQGLSIRRSAFLGLGFGSSAGNWDAYLASPAPSELEVLGVGGADGNLTVGDLTINGTCTGCPGGAGAVTSFETRTGDVVSAAGDYTCSEVTGCTTAASRHLVVDCDGAGDYTEPIAALAFVAGEVRDIDTQWTVELRPCTYDVGTSVLAVPTYTRVRCSPGSTARPHGGCTVETDVITGPAITLTAPFSAISGLRVKNHPGGGGLSGAHATLSVSGAGTATVSGSLLWSDVNSTTFTHRTIENAAASLTDLYLYDVEVLVGQTFGASQSVGVYTAGSTNISRMHYVTVAGGGDAAIEQAGSGSTEVYDSQIRQTWTDDLRQSAGTLSLDGSTTFDTANITGTATLTRLATTGAGGLLPALSGVTTDFLRGDGAWAVPPGDVAGPASSTDDAFAFFDGTTGKAIQELTGITFDDATNFLSLTGGLTVANGATATPSIRSTTSTTTGFSFGCLGQANEFCYSKAGSLHFYTRVSPAAFVSVTGHMWVPNGLSFGSWGDQDTFWRMDGTDLMTARAGGTTALEISETGNVATTRITGATVNAPVSATCADSGNGSPGTLVLAVAGVSYAPITNADPDGCTFSISETSAQDGQLLEVVLVSNAGGTVDLSDTAGVTEMAGNYSMAVEDAITFRYAATRWVETGRSNN